MHRRTLQDEALRDLGYNLEPHAKHNEHPDYGFKSSRNKTLPNKQVVDCSVLPNLLDETHQVRNLGIMSNGTKKPISLLTSSLVQQQIEGTDTLSMKEYRNALPFMFWAIGFANIMGRLTFSGMRVTLPKVGIAGCIWMISVSLRYTLTGCIVGTYFDLYQFLYQKVPGFKIDDPSDYGWKQPWKEGQSTYRARIASSVSVGLAGYFHTGRIKFFHPCFMAAAFFGCYYEYSRVNINSGMRLFYSFVANKEMERQAQFGSLMPILDRKNDPDTGKTEQVHQHRYFQITTGLLRDQVWDSNTHENFPMHSKGMKMANPYYNWQKAKQGYGDKPIVVKNDLWTLPEVLSSQMRAGALDRVAVS